MWHVNHPKALYNGVIKQLLTFPGAHIEGCETRGCADVTVIRNVTSHLTCIKLMSEYPFCCCGLYMLLCVFLTVCLFHFLQERLWQSPRSRWFLRWWTYRNWRIKVRPCLCPLSSGDYGPFLWFFSHNTALLVALFLYRLQMHAEYLKLGFFLSLTIAVLSF